MFSSPPLLDAGVFTLSSPSPGRVAGLIRAVRPAAIKASDVEVLLNVGFEKQGLSLLGLGQSIWVFPWGKVRSRFPPLWEIKGAFLQHCGCRARPEPC